MIHLKITLDKRRIKKDLTHPIVFRLTYRGQTRDIASGYSCLISEWDNKTNMLITNSKKNKEIITIIQNKELDILKKIRSLSLDEKRYTIQDIKDYITNNDKHTDLTVKELYNIEIERMYLSKRFGNAKSYESSLSGLEKELSLNVTFDKIDYKWLLKAETTLRARGLQTNTVGAYFRALRAIYNQAINLGVIDVSCYPFRRYTIKTEKKSPRRISIEDMRKFFDYQPTSIQRERAHDFGKLIFMLRGINFTDLAILKQNNLKGNRLIYNRSKTKTLYNIEILNCAKDIILKYKGVDLLLDILNDDKLLSESKLTKVIALKRKVLNKYLSVIGKEIGIQEPLSTYVFRYTHAGICRDLGYSKDLISQSLGHINTNGAAVTDRYLNDYDYKLIDEMNKNVINHLIKNKRGC